MFKRLIPLVKKPQTSFFLWGGRQTGKSTLLRHLYPHALFIDLLDSDLFLRYTLQPSRIREVISVHPKDQLIIIDEIQRVPSLLSEVQRLIDQEHRVFALSGSSARQLHRAGVHLLGGRALRYHLFPLVSAEMKESFSLDHCLLFGSLPPHILVENPAPLLSAYTEEYLRGEILNEGLVRKLPVFYDFMRIAALSDGCTLNMTTIARECGVSSPTVKTYFDILCETLIGQYLPAFHSIQKRRAIYAPKFYFRNIGIVNSLLKRTSLARGTPEYGHALENWIHHELSAFIDYSQTNTSLSYWRLTTGAEVDFIVGDMHYAIEVKSNDMLSAHHFHGLREVKKDHPSVRQLLIYSGKNRYITDDGIHVYPVEDFLKALWSNTLLS